MAEIIAPPPLLACPAFVLTAEQDHGNSSDISRAIAAEFKAAKLIILPGLHHLALVGNPDAVNRPLRASLDGLS